MTAELSACLPIENPGRSPRTAVVAVPADLALRVAAAVVAAGPEGRVGVEVSAVAAQVAVLSAASQTVWLPLQPWAGLVAGCCFVSEDAWEGHSLSLLWYLVFAVWVGLGCSCHMACTSWLSASSPSPVSSSSPASSSSPPPVFPSACRCFPPSSGACLRAFS